MEALPMPVQSAKDREEFDAWSAAKVTLNGERAKIVGRFLPFRSVVSLESAAEAEYSNEAIRSIIAKGGNFKA